MSPLQKYENKEVNINLVARYEEVNFIPLHLNYKKALFLTSLVWSSILIVAYIICYIMIPWSDLAVRNIIGIVLVLLLFIISAIAYYGYYYMGYALRERDIIFKKGIFFRKTTMIPFNRIQHCEVKNGPIDRMLDLATLKIFTAGGHSSDLEIPGLHPEKAQLIKQFIIGRTVHDEEE